MGELSDPSVGHSGGRTLSPSMLQKPDFREHFATAPGLYLVLDPEFRIVACRHRRPAHQAGRREPGDERDQLQPAGRRGHARVSDQPIEVPRVFALVDDLVGDGAPAWNGDALR